MSLTTQVSALATQLGTDVKAIIGSIGTLDNLTTTEKTSLVGALNELHTYIGTVEAALGASIDDDSTDSSTTWSSEKISSAITEAINALVDGAPEAMDTLKELADALETNSGAIEALQTIAAGHVKYDEAQSLTETQQAQARDNIGAASATRVEEAYSAAVAAEGAASQAQSDASSAIDTASTAQTTANAANEAATAASTAAAAAQSTAEEAKAAAEAAQTAVDGKQDAGDYITTTDAETKISEAIDSLVNGAPEAMDTLKELADAIETNGDAITALREIAASHVSYTDSQSLTETQKETARTNIDAVATADLADYLKSADAASTYATIANVGDTDTDFVSAYTAARDA